MATFVKVAEAGELAPGQVKTVIVKGKRIALCNAQGHYYAVGDVCSHDQGPLGQGEVDGDTIECPRHGARFDVKTGRALTLPAIHPIPTYPVRIRGKAIEVEI